MKPATRNLLILGVCIVVLGGALAALMLTGGETADTTELLPGGETFALAAGWEG